MHPIFCALVSFHAADRSQPSTTPPHPFVECWMSGAITHPGLVAVAEHDHGVVAFHPPDQGPRKMVGFFECGGSTADLLPLRRVYMNRSGPKYRRDPHSFIYPLFFLAVIVKHSDPSSSIPSLSLTCPAR